MKKFVRFNVALILGVLSIVVYAEPTPIQTYNLDEVTHEVIQIKGKLFTTTLVKVCIGGHFYLLLSDTSISPYFKDGKPEQCENKKNK